MSTIIKDISKVSDTIFDPFMGSGTTGVACVQTGRNFIGCEIDPKYFAIAETEWGLNIMKYKNFLVDVMGQPWETKAEKKDWRELMARSEEYRKGEIPTGGLLLTGGADIQKNRIELCVTAWGRDMGAVS